MSVNPDPFIDVLHRFGCDGAVVACETFTQGHINHSFRVTLRTSGGNEQFFLQKLNTEIFHQPQQLMENIDRVTRHIAQRLAADPTADVQRNTLHFLRAVDGKACAVDASGDYWRLCRFIERSHSRVTAESAKQVAMVAREFGRFHALLSDLPSPRLHETIHDFHNTPVRLAQLKATIAADTVERVAQTRDLITLVERNANLASALESLRQNGVPERIAHNDAKISNILLDDDSGAPLCVVDLDTVMPGLSLYDFGDMVRTMATLAAEDERDTKQVTVAPELFGALVDGYLSTAGDLLTTAERSHLLTAGLVITFEQAIRFLNDYLQGDTYYQTDYPQHNLIRARAQFALLSDLQARATELVAYIPN